MQTDMPAVMLHELQFVMEAGQAVLEGAVAAVTGVTDKARLNARMERRQRRGRWVGRTAGVVDAAPVAAALARAVVE